MTHLLPVKQGKKNMKISRKTIFATVVLGAGLIGTTLAWGATPAKAASSDQPTKQAAASDFVGSETCAGCHEEKVNKFASNPHAKLAEQHGKTGVTCEGCHGAGRAHVDGGGDKTKIFNPAHATAKEVNARCLGCHEKQHADFEHSAHADGNVSCIGCHNIHDSKDQDTLLKASQPTLCFQCHNEVKSQFSMPFHHKVEEGLMNCSDCHNPHGTFDKKNLKSAAQQDAVCVKCHTETAGPFVYEHAAVKTEGCTSCHFPHGGPNPRLLTKASVNSLCLQCHSPSTNFTTSAPLGPAHNQAAQYQACTVCHTDIHGSNVSSVFFHTTF